MENNNQQQPPPPPPSFHQLQQQHQQLQMFWNYQRQEIEHANDFKNHQLPLARIKKIMKSDEDVRMISAEAPILFAKACELFILELTIRSWMHAEENKRRTLQKNDIAAAITRTNIFDFLVDIVPREEVKEEALMMTGEPAADGIPYYYPHADPGVMMGQPAIGSGMYAEQQHQWQPIWQHGMDDDSCHQGYGYGGQGYVSHPPPPPPPPPSL